jgi:predicted phage tail protein
MKYTKNTLITLLFFILLSVPFQTSAVESSVLRWERVPGAIRYIVELRNSNGRTIQRYTTQNEYQNVAVTPGNYKVRITPVNIFGEEEQVSSWQNFTVSILRRAVISSFTPNYFNDNEESIRFTVSGENFSTNTTFYLESNGRRFNPLSSNVTDSTKAQLFF